MLLVCIPSALVMCLLVPYMWITIVYWQCSFVCMIIYSSRYHAPWTNEYGDSRTYTHIHTYIHTYISKNSFVIHFASFVLWMLLVGYENSHVRFLGNLVLNLWDCGGCVCVFVCVCAYICVCECMVCENVCMCMNVCVCMCMRLRMRIADVIYSIIYSTWCVLLCRIQCAYAMLPRMCDLLLLCMCDQTRFFHGELLWKSTRSDFS